MTPPASEREKFDKAIRRYFFYDEPYFVDMPRNHDPGAIRFPFFYGYYTSQLIISDLVGRFQMAFHHLNRVILETGDTVRVG